MNEWIIRLAALAILLSAVALACWHFRVRRTHRRTELPPAQYDYFRRQFRRRIQVSAMLGLLAVLLAVESWLEKPLLVVLVGVGMLGLVLWIMLLALVDAVASRFHFDRLRSDYIVERAKLEAEARRLRGSGGNGKPRGKPIEKQTDDPR